MAWTTGKQSASAANGMSAGYETRDLSVRGLTWFVVAFVASVFVIHVAVALILRGMSRPRGQHFPAEEPEVHLSELTRPRLQVPPAEEMEQFRVREESVLNSYDWIDRAHGIVRIPITQAMELVVKEGSPVRPAPPSPGKGEERK